MEAIGQGGPRAALGWRGPWPDGVIEAPSRRLTPDLVFGAIEATGR